MADEDDIGDLMRSIAVGTRQTDYDAVNTANPRYSDRQEDSPVPDTAFEGICKQFSAMLAVPVHVQRIRSTPIPALALATMMVLHELEAHAKGISDLSTTHKAAEPESSNLPAILPQHDPLGVRMPSVKVDNQPDLDLQGIYQPMPFQAIDWLEFLLFNNTLPVGLISGPDANWYIPGGVMVPPDLGGMTGISALHQTGFLNGYGSPELGLAPTIRGSLTPDIPMRNVPDYGPVFQIQNAQGTVLNSVLPIAFDEKYSVNDVGLFESDVINNNLGGQDYNPTIGLLRVISVNGQSINTGDKITLPGGAILTINPDGTFHYDTAGQYDYVPLGKTTTDSFTYTITNLDGNVDTATVTITIIGTNQNPVARDDSAANLGAGATTDQNTKIIPGGNVLLNDSDVDEGTVLQVVSIDTSGTQGLVTDNQDGTFNYDPNGQYIYLAQGEVGYDTFKYTISDGQGGFASATVTIKIIGLNDAPTANPDSGPAFTTDQNTLFSTGSVLLNDTDPDLTDTLTVVGFNTATTVGTVTNNGDGTFTYDPGSYFKPLALGENATTTFSYTISDNYGATSTAIVTIEIIGLNDVPIGFDDAGRGYTYNKLNPEIFTTPNVLANDFDIDNGHVLSVKSVDSTSANGAVITDNHDGTFNYNPLNNFIALQPGERVFDTFQYTVTDEYGATSQAMVTIVVNASLDLSITVDDLVNKTDGVHGVEVIGDFNGNSEIDIEDYFISFYVPEAIISGNAYVLGDTWIASPGIVEAADNGGGSEDLLLISGSVYFPQGSMVSHEYSNLYILPSIEILGVNGSGDDIFGLLNQLTLSSFDFYAHQTIVFNASGPLRITGLDGNDFIVGDINQLNHNFALANVSGTDADQLNYFDLYLPGGEIIDGAGGDDEIIGDINIIKLAPQMNSSAPISTIYFGSDVINAGSGNDTIYGDYKTIISDSGSVTPAFSGGNDVIFGGDDNDTIFGQVGDDYISGDLGNDLLDGGVGNDILLGGASADILIGGDGFDTADYSGSPQAVNIDLELHIGLGGDAQGDTLFSIEKVIGTHLNDILIGDANNNEFVGGPGADVIDGRLGIDTVDYSQSIQGVNVDLLFGSGLGGDAEGDILSSIENVIGSNLADKLAGDSNNNILKAGGGNDILIGRSGADVLDGGAGIDTVTYRDASAGVVVNLITGGTGGEALGDSYISIENITGSNFADTLVGDNSDNVIIGGAGPDSMDGGLGIDTLDYQGSNAGVVVSLVAGVSSGGDAQGDTNVNFENLLGSIFDDTLEGNASVNFLDGRQGVNTLSYASSVLGVNVNLQINTVSGGNAQGDTILNFKNIIGTNVADTLVALNSGSIISGRGGADTIIGAGGDDILLGGSGNDAIQGLAGNDTIEGGSGADVLNGGSGINTLSYESSSSAVNVTLGISGPIFQQGGDAQGDQTSNFQNVIGSNFNDTVTADSQVNILDGRGGIDTLSYENSTAPVGVTVNLATNQVSGGDATGDTISNFENVTGTQYSDSIFTRVGSTTVNNANAHDYINMSHSTGYSDVINITTSNIFDLALNGFELLDTININGANSSNTLFENNVSAPLSTYGSADSPYNAVTEEGLKITFFDQNNAFFGTIFIANFSYNGSINDFPIVYS